ncbi:MAG: hypothetical protein M1823_003542 [Watsoniomyces obsoletus]|nr:MAG: hypothetical protein M1823_003542 [Watsoniomyces obsoletus]
MVTRSLSGVLHRTVRLYAEPVMEGRAVAMSTKKSDFFVALGLDIEDPWHCRLYQLMNEQTEEVWEELVADRSKRRPQAQNKPEPWSYGDFTEAAIEDAVRRITENANDHTRPLFQIGHADQRGDQYWPARWVLYHIFRNRDARNRSRNRNTRGSSVETEKTTDEGDDMQPYLPSSSQRGRVYDPIRDQ